MFKPVLAAAAIGAAGFTIAPSSADAAPVDADIMFVVDSSASMGGEFSFLAGAIDGFLSDLRADSRIGTVRAGLISYTNSATLHADLTEDAAALSTAFGNVRVGGGVENAYQAVDSAIPGAGSYGFSISYDPSAVRTLVLITDEDADDYLTYSNIFGTGESAVGALLDDQNFLNNVIYQPYAKATDDFDGISRPSSGLFSINEFRDNRTTFFDEFTRTKIREIVEEGGGEPSVVPLPAGLPLLIGGLAALGIAGRRKRAA